MLPSDVVEESEMASQFWRLHDSGR